MLSTPSVLEGNPKVSNDAPAILLRLAARNYRISGVPGSWRPVIPGKLLALRTDDAGPDDSCHQLHINVVADGDHLRPTNELHNLNETSELRYHPGKVEYFSDWCSGSLLLSDPFTMHLDCHIEADSAFAGVLENALRLMVAYDVLLRGGLLMHSAAIVINDSASVLFGHSGAGKSTTSRIAMESGFSVLSDDINVLLNGKSGWQVNQVPFCGTLDPNYYGPGIHPLSGLYRLQMDEQTMLGEYSSAQAISVICGSAAFVNQDPFRADLLLDRAEQLIGSCPVKKLYFRKDQEFLELIREKD